MSEIETHLIKRNHTGRERERDEMWRGRENKGVINMNDENEHLSSLCVQRKENFNGESTAKWL